MIDLDRLPHTFTEELTAVSGPLNEEQLDKLAEYTVKECGVVNPKINDTTLTKIVRGMQFLVGRHPNPVTTNLLMTLMRKHLERYKHAPRD